ncbi:MAG: RsmE family RNA methyltransferase [Candidatus Limnocylindria bacterium]|nr:RsmE family RNA methyltransferase [Candidatus Limnocylindria bacterium]
MTHRFFVAGDTLAPEQCRQIATVLRLAPGAVVTLVRDGLELDYRLDRVGRDEVIGTVVARRPAAGEPRVALTLGLPLLRGDRSEEVIEAASQLGVSRFAPYASTRSVVRTLSAEKRERWRRIGREAAETARRGRVPTIDEARDWPALLAALPGPLVVAWEEERKRALEATLEVLAQPPDVSLAAAPGPFAVLSLVVGPEGGLTEDEVALARERGGLTVSLGRRVLRAETAAIAAVARVVAALD